MNTMRPSDPLHGLMLDAARLVEAPEYYRRFIDFCADWQATRAGDPLAGYAQLATWGFGPEDWLHGHVS